jgi:hypothetical protein
MPGGGFIGAASRQPVPLAGGGSPLQANFPAVLRLVGKEFFREMARLYVLSEPPTSPILLDYGAGFPDFIASFVPAGALVYLPDVARIERAWTESYHAPDAAPLPAAAAATIPKDRVANARRSKQRGALTDRPVKIGNNVTTPRSS